MWHPFKKKKKYTEEYFNREQERLDDEYRKQKQKITFMHKLNLLRFPTYTKNLVAAIIFVCLLDLQFTYVLAFLGKDQIAEGLSNTLCTTILGVAFMYIIRAYFDSRLNNRPTEDNGEHEESKVTKHIKKKIKEKTSSILTSAVNALNMEDDEVDFSNNDDIFSSTGNEIDQNIFSNDDEEEFDISEENYNLPTQEEIIIERNEEILAQDEEKVKSNINIEIDDLLLKSSNVMPNSGSNDTTLRNIKIRNKEDYL